MSKKTIWLNPPLQQLLSENQEGNFSRRLGDIVERYNVIMSIVVPLMPEFSPEEFIILKDLLLKNKRITAVFIDSMPKYIDLITSGSLSDRNALKIKIEGLTPIARMALIELVEKN